MSIATEMKSFPKTVTALRKLAIATEYAKRVGVTVYLYKTARGWKIAYDKQIANTASATVLEVNP